MMFKISLAANDIGAPARDRRPQRGDAFDIVIRRPATTPPVPRTARPAPDEREWWRPMAKAASSAMNHIVESLAFYALATHPDQSWRWTDDGALVVEDRDDSYRVQPYREAAVITVPALEYAAIARAKLAPSGTDSRTWLSSMPAALWSALRRARESRRMRAAWNRIDDRTLADIGVSRHEIERITGEWRR
jgi:uncharacterized protein YjiS (DUF1127 family)